MSRPASVAPFSLVFRCFFSHRSQKYDANLPFNSPFFRSERAFSEPWKSAVTQPSHKAPNHALNKHKTAAKRHVRCPQADHVESALQLTTATVENAFEETLFASFETAGLKTPRSPGKRHRQPPSAGSTDDQIDRQYRKTVPTAAPENGPQATPARGTGRRPTKSTSG